MVNISNLIFKILELAILIFLIYIKKDDLEEVYGEEFNKKYPNNLNKFLYVFILFLCLLFFTLRGIDSWLYNAFTNLILMLISIIFLLKSKEYIKSVKLRKYAIKELLLSAIIIIVILKYFLIEAFSKII